MDSLIGRKIIILHPSIWINERGTIAKTANFNLWVSLDIGINIKLGLFDNFFLIESANIINTNPKLN